jgi:hypothetical protein
MTNLQRTVYSMTGREESGPGGARDKEKAVYSLVRFLMMVLVSMVV